MYARTDAPLLAALRTRVPAQDQHKRDKDGDTTAPGALLANELGAAAAAAEVDVVRSVVLPPSRSDAEVAPAVDCWICEAV